MKIYEIHTIRTLMFDETIENVLYELKIGTERIRDPRIK